MTVSRPTHQSRPNHGPRQSPRPSRSPDEEIRDLLGECDIQESALTDYAYRLFVKKSAWTQVLAGLAEETDYDNFKSEVARHQGRAGGAYEDLLHEV